MVNSVVPMCHIGAKIPEPIIIDDKSLAPPRPAEHILLKNAIANALLLGLAKAIISELAATEDTAIKKP